MILKDTIRKYLRDSGPRLAAALAYYTLFSLAPLLIIAVAIVGFVYGQEAAQGHIMVQLSEVMGETAAHFVEQVIVGISRPGSGVTATVISSVILFVAASRIFNHLRFSLNVIWSIKEKEKQPVVHRLKSRAFSFLLVLFTGVVFMVSIAVSTTVTALVSSFEHLFPGLPFLWETVNFFLLLGISTCVFALIFKYGASARVGWNPVWVGALFTSLLFSIGRILLGIYLGNFALLSAYGAAASLLVILLWLYYSSQILFLGAEFTQIYAARRGTPVVPYRNAELLKP